MELTFHMCLHTLCKVNIIFLPLGVQPPEVLLLDSSLILTATIVHTVTGNGLHIAIMRNPEM